MNNNQAVQRYYDWSQLGYSMLWSRDGLHFGHWESGTRNVQEAVHNSNRMVARLLEIGPEDRVLDAGCGIGGTSLMIAEETGCQILGLTLSQVQQTTAAARSLRSKASARTDFLVRDYTDTRLPDASFSKMFALESANYSNPKSKFVAEAYRLLKPGGKILIVDGYLTERSFARDPQGSQAYRLLLEGWALEALCTVEQMRATLEGAGLQDISYTDQTEDVMPSIREIHKRGVVMYPLMQIANWWGRGGAVFRRNVEACIAQRRLFDDGYMVYGMFIAHKPGC